MRSIIAAISGALLFLLGAVAPAAAGVTWQASAATTGYCLGQWAHWDSPPVEVRADSPEAVLQQGAAISVASNCGVSWNRQWCDPYTLTDGASSGSTICHIEGQRASVGPEIAGGPVTWQCPPGQSYRSALNACAPPVTADPGEAGSTCNAAGNPINVGIGNKYQIDTDYVGAGDFPLVMRRYYNLGNVTPTGYTPMGAHWRGHYDRSLEFFDPAASGASPTRIAAWRADGKIVYFNQSGAAWLAKDDVNLRLAPLFDTRRVQTGWTLRTDTDELETYDLQGRLQSIAPAGGAIQTLSRDDQGRVIAVTDLWGHTLTFTYGQNNFIDRVTTPDGLAIQYGYTGELLSTVRFSDGATRTYLYSERDHTGGADLPYALTGIVAESGTRYATFTYDASGRAISTEHAGGVEKFSVSYGADQSTITDPLGTTRTHHFQTVQGIARLSGVDQPGGSGSGCGAASSTQDHDAHGNVTRATDFNGNTATFAYDLTRNLETRRTEAFGTTEARIISTRWHPDWRLPVAIAEPLKITTWVYNGQPDPTRGNAIAHCAPLDANVAGLPIAVPCKRIEQATTDPDGSAGFDAKVLGMTPRIQVRNWNAAGQMLLDSNAPDQTRFYTWRDADDSADPPQYRRGDLYTITDTTGQRLTITRTDRTGRPLQWSDTNGATTTLAYNPRGWLDASTDAAGDTTTLEHDATGQLTRIASPDGATLTLSHDSAQRLTAVQDEQGNRIAWTLDAIGNRIEEALTDVDGQIIQQQRRLYDALNRLQQLTAGADADGLTTGYGHDALGNLTTLTDALGRVTTQAHDALNRLTEVRQSAVVTRYRHDGQDQLTAVTDPRGLMTRYTINGLGEQTTTLSPDSGTSTNVYASGDGTVSMRRDARGLTTNYNRMTNGRLTRIQDGSGVDAIFTYDGGHAPEANDLGRLTGWSDASGATRLRYDIKGRVIGRTQGSGGTAVTGTIPVISQTVTYAYGMAGSGSATGHLTTVTYPSGLIVHQGWTQYAKLGAIDLEFDGQTQPLLGQRTERPFGGPVTGWVWGNGTAVTRRFDLAGRLTGYTIAPGRQRTLRYDAGSRIVGITDDGDITPRQYAYDAQDRLIQAILPNTVYGYRYDANGNRTRTLIGAREDSNTIDPASNRLLSSTGMIPSSNTYDAAGNLIDDGSRRYTYNNAGRLMGVQIGNAKVSYFYNALGQRILKTGPEALVPGGVVRYVYDQDNHLLGEYDAAGKAIQETVWMGDTPVAVVKPGADGRREMFYIYADHLDTPRAIVRPADNAVVWRWEDREPFGLTPPDENPGGFGVFTFNLRFPGQVFDRETGLFYNLNRYYDSARGRYTQSDPVGLAGGLNTYGYAGANPVSRIDPDGRFFFVAIYGWTAAAMAGDFVVATATSWWITQQTKTPSKGDPDSWWTNPSNGQERKYGPDGSPENDVDWHPDHGAGTPHGHNWDKDERGSPVRGPAVPLSPWPKGKADPRKCP